jgi:hypothetical protein
MGQFAHDLRELTHTENRAFKTVLNEVLRDGLRARGQKRIPVFREKPFSMGLRPEFEGKLNQMFDELELEAAIAKLSKADGRGKRT